MIGAIVLAAGASRRYGRVPKQLAPLDSCPLIAHSLRALSQHAFRPVVIVTGAAAPRVRSAARRYAPPDRTLRITHNVNHARGMAGSLQKGLSALPLTCDATLICLADMPAVDTSVLRRLRAAWRPGVDYARTIHRGRPGHPVLISRRLFDAINQLDGYDGARTVFARVPADRRRLIQASTSCTLDIDTPRQLRAMRTRVGHARESNV